MDVNDGISIKITTQATPYKIPEEQGNYAKTVFLDTYGKNSPIRYASDYVGYVSYELGIKDANKYHKNLIQEGYLIEDDISGSLSTLKIDELKELANSYGIKLKGKKVDMVRQLISECNNEELRAKAPTTYSLSEKGKDFIANNYHYVELHKHRNWTIDWREYDKKKEQLQNNSFYEVVKSMLKEGASKDQRFFGKYYYRCLSELEEQYGSLEMAYNYMLQVLYIDLSGVNGVTYYDDYKNGFYNKQELLDMFPSIIVISSSTMDKMKRHVSHYNPAAVEKLYCWKLPIQICDKETFYQLMQSLVDGTYDYESINYVLKKKYSQFVDGL